MITAFLAKNHSGKLARILLTLITAGSGLAESVAQQAPDPFITGDRLYADVKKYVALGEHRTATEADYATSAWLNDRFKQKGFKTNYVPFPVKQFFPQKSSVILGPISINAFPLWFVHETGPLTVNAQFVDPRRGDSVNGKIALVRFPAPGGQLSPAHAAPLEKMIEQGVKGIVIISEGTTGEIVAFNTFGGQKPWKVPVVLVAPKDSTSLLDAIHKTVSLSIQGSFKAQEARNLTAQIGNGSRYIIISTPISGWFRCGGERGPGVAIFNALADWVGENYRQYPAYTFLFTANSGHELDFLGSHIFLHGNAPKPAQVALWLHLGAGIATYDWKATGASFQKIERAPDQRNIMFSPSLEQAVQKGFAGLPGKRVKVKDGAMGEMGEVAGAGYRNFYGVAYAHRFHHVRSDDETNTSPKLLEEAALAIRRTLEIALSANYSLN